MLLVMNKDGKLEKYKPYASIDFDTKEDYEAFQKILDEHNNKEDHDGCVDCRYEHNRADASPCNKCKQSYLDKYTFRKE